MNAEQSRASLASTFGVEVTRPPQVAKLGILYTYPAYTGLSPKRIDGSDVAK